MSNNAALVLSTLGLAVASLLFARPAAAQQDCASLSLPADTRPPYLQMGGPTSMTVRWDSAASNQGWVKYRRVGDTTWIHLNEPGSRTAHEVRLTGLADNTQYEYQVGSGAQTLYQGPEYYFLSAPQRGSTGANLRILALGDAGGFGYGAGDYRAQNTCRLLQAYERWAPGQPTDLVLLLGDNAYNDGSAAQYSAQFNGFAPLWRHAAVWPAIGNHENNAAAYKSAFTLPTSGDLGGAPSNTEEYYSFDYGNVHVIALNSDYSGGAGWTNTNIQSQVGWLRSDLQQMHPNTRWVIAFWHHPPYSHSASHSVSEGPMDAFRDQIVPILEEYGVDLVLGGHNHYYERTHYIHGLADGQGTSNHATLFAQNRNSYVVVDGAGISPVYQKQSRTVNGRTVQVGTMYVMAGNASKVDYTVLAYAPRWVAFGVLGYTVTNSRDKAIGANQPGWFVFDIANNGLRLNARYLSLAANGMGIDQSISDAFTIDKSGGVAPPPPLPDGGVRPPPGDGGTSWPPDGGTAVPPGSGAGNGTNLVGGCSLRPGGSAAASSALFLLPATAWLVVRRRRRNPNRRTNV